MGPQRFNIRVYGLLLKEDSVLISLENLDGFEFVKFPGGGLEFGEGILDCLQREFREELGVEIQSPELFYINDFYQASKFSASDQLISIYYTLKSAIPVNSFSVTETKPDGRLHTMLFEWKTLHTLTADDFTFPVDKVVIQKLKASLGANE